MRKIFKIEMLIYHSNANLDEKVLFGKITNHLDPYIRKMLAKGRFGKKNPTFHFGPLFYLLLKSKFYL